MKRWMALFLILALFLTQCMALAEEPPAYSDEDTVGEPPPAFNEEDHGDAPPVVDPFSSLGGGESQPAFDNPPAPDSTIPDVGIAEETAEFVKPDYSNERVLRVGNTTPMNGEFFLDIWGEATSDQDVRHLLHGYNLVRWDGENGMYVIDDSVVSGLVAVSDDDGNHAYIIGLYEDLKYSDGTGITAWDYAFSLLLSMAPEMEELGAHPKDMRYILGYNEYVSGQRSYLTGVNVLGDYQMMITLNHEYLPYFYELGLLSVEPYPISVIAPGCKVLDDGLGVYIANEEGSEDSEPLFTAANLEETIMDPDVGYLSHPSVVSGPYVLDSFDGEKAEFTANPYYKGNWEGRIPAIKRISLETVSNSDMLEKLNDGEIDLLNKVTQADVIREGMNAMASGVAMANYPRQGLSYVSINCERPAVSSENVRKALALCMDKDALVSEYVGYYGLRVDGFYGIGQWMYTMLNGRGATYLPNPGADSTQQERDNYNDTVAAWNALNLDGLTIYNLDVETAKRLLIADGWTLNEDGGAYTEILSTATDLEKAEAGIRYKKIEGELVPLSLKLIYPEGNRMGSSMEEHWVPYLREAGVELTLEPVSMMELMYEYQKTPEMAEGEDARDCDLIYLATNFSFVYDPASYFIPDAEGNETWNYTGLADKTMYELALAVSNTDLGDSLHYIQRWVAFQNRFSAVLPAIPVYSNVYFDFYTEELENYSISENTSWAEGVITANFAKEEEAVIPVATPVPTMEPEEDHSGGVFFD